MEEKSPVKPKQADGPEPNKKPKKKYFWFCGIFFIVIALFIVPRIIYLANYKEETKSETAVTAQPNSQTTKKPNTTAKTVAKKTSQGEESVNQQSENNQPNTMLEYFIDTAVYDYQKREFFVTRWAKSDVSVGVAEGTFTDSLNNCLNNFISDFNQESSSSKLRRDDTVDTGIPNIKIYYWEDSQFKERAGQDATYGVTEWIHKDDKSLQRSMIFFSHELMNVDEAVRCQVVRHEMMHALGFWGHSSAVPEGILSSPKTRYIYPDEDKRLVKMLYNSGVAIGSNVEAARSFFRSNSGW